jgi:hypothetical protein
LVVEAAVEAALAALVVEALVAVVLEEIGKIHRDEGNTVDC